MSVCVSRWSARGQDATRLGLFLIVLFSVISPVVLLYDLSLPFHVNDFYAFRSFSAFIAARPAGGIYVVENLRPFQTDMTGTSYYPYIYHPGMLLLVWPLAHLPYGIGYALWSGVSLLVYLAVVRMSAGNLVAVLAALVAPSTLIVVAWGQSSCLAAALMIGGFALLPRRPLLAGIMFGLLTYKPQLGLLLPVALVALRQWRCIAAASVTSAGIVFASSAAFGWDIWLTWLHALPSIWHLFDISRMNWASHMMTISAKLISFGAGPVLMHAGQALTGTIGVGCVWFCFRRGAGPLPTAVLVVATFVSTPYAFCYDLPLLTAAIVGFIMDVRQRDGVFTFLEIMLLTSAYLVAFSGLSPSLFRLAGIVLLALLYVLMRRVVLETSRVDRSVERPASLRSDLPLYPA